MDVIRHLKNIFGIEFRILKKWQIFEFIFIHRTTKRLKIIEIQKNELMGQYYAFLLNELSKRLKSI